MSTNDKEFHKLADTPLPTFTPDATKVKAATSLFDQGAARNPSLDVTPAKTKLTPAPVALDSIEVEMLQPAVPTVQESVDVEGPSGKGVGSIVVSGQKQRTRQYKLKQTGFGMYTVHLKNGGVTPSALSHNYTDVQKAEAAITEYETKEALALAAKVA